MNPKLLDSQLATLEYPLDAIRVVNDRPPDEIVESILAKLERAGFRLNRRTAYREECEWDTRCLI